MKKLSSESQKKLTRGIALATVLIGITYSCASDEGANEDEPDPARVPVLKSAGTCTLDAVSDFNETTATLTKTAKAWKESPEDDSLREALQESWRQSMKSFQVVELMRMGPNGSSGSLENGGSVGGQDLADEIYSWPTSNACVVDQKLTDLSFEDDFASLSVNARGLDALEYVAFYAEAENSCASTVNINQDGSWDAIEDLTSRRASYAHQAALNIADFAQKMLDAWHPDAGNFVSDLENAGTSGAYPNQSTAMDDVVAAMLYVDEILKDLKLAMPMGIHTNCPESTCPESVEHPFAKVSVESLRANISAFESLFLGCGGKDKKGFDALLDEAGAGALKEQIINAVATINAELDKIDDADLNTVIESDSEQAEALYAAVKDLTDLLKNDFADVLMINLRVVGGDND